MLLVAKRKRRKDNSCLLSKNVWNIFFCFSWWDSRVHLEKNVYMKIKRVQSLLLFCNNLSSQFCFLCNIPAWNKQIKKTNVLNQLERSSPLYPFPFVVGMFSWLQSWLWDKVSYSQLLHIGSHTPCFSLNTASAGYNSANFFHAINIKTMFFYSIHKTSNCTFRSFHLRRIKPVSYRGPSII